MTFSNWYAPIAPIEGRGLHVKNLKGLAGLAAARAEHQGSFFTPTAVARWAWHLVAPAIDAAVDRTGGRVSLLDTSAGSGRLLQFADPSRHTLAVIDPDEGPLRAFASAAEGAGFDVDCLVGRLETVRPRHFGCALLNPPFGLTVRSAGLVPGVSTCFGPLGPNTSATSHAYALEQAIDAAAIGVAILPWPFAKRVHERASDWPRVRALFRLPADAFALAGTRVATGLVVWGAEPCSAEDRIFRRLQWGEKPPIIQGLETFTESERSPAPLQVITIDRRLDVIGLPVTGCKRVLVAHSGRRLVLKFGCGFVKARVLNALLRAPVPPIEHGQPRRPAGVRFVGQGWFDLELWQTAPRGAVAHLQALLSVIRAQGGDPDMDPGLVGYLRRRARRLQRERTPMRRFVAAANPGLDHENRPFRCKTGLQWDPDRWGSPYLRPGTPVLARLNADPEQVCVSYRDQERVFERSSFDAMFDAGAGRTEQQESWTQVAPGVAFAFPALARQLSAQAQRRGVLDRLWSYQRTDLIELLVKGRGIAACEQAYGKTFLAVALCLMTPGRRPGLIVTEPYLLGEFRAAISQMGLSADQWQVISGPQQCDTLARVNVISYTRLRAKAGPGKRKSIARLLRRRIHTVVVDEGESLSNPDSDRSRAVRDLAAPHRYCATGTPNSNYVRGLLPLVMQIAGDGTASQPYGWYRGQFDPAVRSDASHAERGVDVFRRRHVVLEWQTPVFEDTLITGAKREVPKVANPAMLRSWLAPWMLRRIKNEPELAPFHRVAVPTIEPVRVAWNPSHLAHYLRIADDFAAYYRDLKRDAEDEGRLVSLTVLLRRLEAVITAANSPWEPVDGFGTCNGGTTKLDAAVAIARRWVAEGRKFLVYARRPTSVRRLAKALMRAGITALPLSGQVAPERRSAMIQTHMREGDTQALVITYAAGQRGINLPQASGVLLYEHAWTPREEDQAIQRVVRAQQTREVEAYVLELDGSVDEYMGQMVAFKRDASRVVIDGATSVMDQQQFIGLDGVLNRFVQELLDRHGIQDREGLKRAEEVRANAA